MVAADQWLSGFRHVFLEHSRCYSQHQGVCFRSVARQGFARLSDTNMRLPLDVRAALTTAMVRLDRVLGVREPCCCSHLGHQIAITLPICQSKYMGSVLKHTYASSYLIMPQYHHQRSNEEAGSVPVRCRGKWVAWVNTHFCRPRAIK